MSAVADAVLEVLEASKTYTAKQREKAPTMDDGSFPIASVADLERAVSSYGRAKDKAKAKAWIIRRAKALGATGKLPDGWNVQEADTSRDSSAGDQHRNVKCPECGLVQSATHDKCSRCGHSLAGARAAKMAKTQEAAHRFRSVKARNLRAGHVVHHGGSAQRVVSAEPVSGPLSGNKIRAVLDGPSGTQNFDPEERLSVASETVEAAVTDVLEANLRDAAASRARWAKWERLHGHAVTATLEPHAEKLDGVVTKVGASGVSFRDMSGNDRHLAHDKIRGIRKASGGLADRIKAGAGVPSAPGGGRSQRETEAAHQTLDPLKVGDAAKHGTVSVKRLPDEGGRAQFSVDGKTMGGRDTVAHLASKGRATASPARSNAPVGSGDKASAERAGAAGKAAGAPKSKLAAAQGGKHGMGDHVSFEVGRRTLTGPITKFHAGGTKAAVQTPEGEYVLPLSELTRKRKTQEADMTDVERAVAEAADSLAKASTPEPFSSSRTSNWVARGGGLPAYIQHIAHDLMEKRGKSESNAIQMAIGIVKRWASGGGNVDANTRAAASKAVAEWEALKAKSKVKEAAVLAVLEAAWAQDDPDVIAEAARYEADAEARAELLEAASKADAEDAKDGGKDEASEDASGIKVFCPKGRHKVTPTKDGKCPVHGNSLDAAIKMHKRLKAKTQEAALPGGDAVQEALIAGLAEL